MAWSLYKFDDVILPDNDPQPDLSQGPVESTLLDSVGSTFDYYGTRQRLPRRQNIAIQGTYLGENGYLVDHNGAYLIDHAGRRLLAGTARNRLRAQLDALTGKLGQRGQLWRQEFERPTVLQWKTARLLYVPHPRESRDVALLARVTCLFETRMAAWRSASVTASTLSSGSGLRSLRVPVLGNVAVNDATIRITASAAITSIQVWTSSGANWTWTGALATGRALLIDAGAQTVRRFGLQGEFLSNEYNGFTLATGRGWLPLNPGENTIRIQTAAPCSVRVEHYNQWL